ncbi:TPM domain-containing protein [Anaeromicropila herbilytica]|uniref:UPF0603 protein YdjH n=1 Tax=Anaeromicropila herbilytica TaxID=2785025 RepID=A0A7R7EJ15_9FIRM|nr:TPM domain-containing protein [Anaeromicropila herbilytica]BCN29624.1 UPF0603 protein YdjH [Anaeromicropila herbilytica]
MKILRQSGSRKYIILFIMLCSFLILWPNHSKSIAASTLQKVYDNASLLTDEERQDLEKMCDTYGDSNNTDIIIITEDSIGNQTTKLYLEKFYDQNIKKASAYDGNCALLLITMDESNRGFQIQGYGDNPNSTQYYLDGERIDHIISKVKPLLSNGKYYDAMKQYINMVDDYVGMKYQHIYNQLWFQLLVSLGIGTIAVSIMIFNSGGKVTVNSGTYLDQNHSKILDQRDDYIRTTITRTEKPKNNDNGGDSSGTSPGGSSHSGGGSSF